MYLSLSGRKSSGGAWIGIVPSGLSTYGADNWGKKRVKLNRQSKEKREREKKRKKKKDPFIRERESPSMATSPPSSSPSASFSSPSLYPSSHSSCHSPPLLSSKSFLLLVSPLQSIRSSSSPPLNLPANHATLPSPLFSGRSHPVSPPNLNFLIGPSTFLLLFRPFCLVRVLLCCCGFSCWH